jgi:alanyl-tRNA synthetase
LERKVEAMLSQTRDLERRLKATQQRQAALKAQELLAHQETLEGTPFLAANLTDVSGDDLQAIADALKTTFSGVVFLVGSQEGNVSIVSTVSPPFISKFAAGKLVQLAAPLVEGKGGGRPDAARGAGKHVQGIPAAIAAIRAAIGG